jgi:hypothetical protein
VCCYITGCLLLYCLRSIYFCIYFVKGMCTYNSRSLTYCLVWYGVMLTNWICEWFIQIFMVSCCSHFPPVFLPVTCFRISEFINLWISMGFYSSNKRKAFMLGNFKVSSVLYLLWITTTTTKCMYVPMSQKHGNFS